MNPPQRNLEGNLLLAAPQLRDPNFNRSVLYVAAHSRTEGAFGFILNRPLEKSVSDLLGDKSFGHLGQVPVYLGGPVSTDKLSFVVFDWSEKRHYLDCRTHLSKEEALHEVNLGNDVRGFIGYSGWSTGQLEKELLTHSWIVSPPEKIIVHSPDHETLWKDLLMVMGPRYQILAQAPEHPEYN
jgi:putative transcriptional regulator